MQLLIEVDCSVALVTYSCAACEVRRLGTVLPYEKSCCDPPSSYHSPFSMPRGCGILDARLPGCASLIWCVAAVVPHVGV